MTAAQVISLYQFDHNILHALDGPDEHWNLTPRLITPHREKSKRDKAIVSKVARVARINEEVQRALLKPTGHKRARSSRWPKGRKLRGRGFEKRRR